jgi:hypothetical protein
MSADLCFACQLFCTVRMKADIHHKFLLFSFQHHKVAIVISVLLFSSHVAQILAEFQNDRLQAIQAYVRNYLFPVTFVLLFLYIAE